MQKKISVVVPIHRVEAYLDRCVQSIVDQTYTNLEIILVDDESPDSCGAMCDAWAAKDDRIRVIHKKNGGLSDARNAGMAVATGEYIGFIDSDDWVAPDMYQLLYERMQEDNSDIAACGVQMVWEDDTPPKMLTAQGSCVLNTEEAMHAVIEESWIKQPVWYKLYKTALVQDLPFAVGKYHEDAFWTYQAVARAQRVSIFDTPCYFYVQRSGSIMGESYSLKRLHAVEAACERQIFLDAYFPQHSTLARAKLHFLLLYHGQRVLRYLNDETYDQAMAFVKDVGDRFAIHKDELQCVKWTHRIWLRLMNISLIGTCKLRNALKIGI